MDKSNSKSQILLQEENNQQQNNKQTKQKTTFLQKVQSIVLVFTVIISISVSIFIEIAVFYFAIDAYGMMRAADVELDVILNLLMLFCKFFMLIMFIAALLAGSLLPLALVYIILSPGKLKKD